MSGDLNISPVILSGGAGTRMWPISRRATPKQFHRLVGDESLLQRTITRLLGNSDRFLAPIILGSVNHQELIQEQLREIQVRPAQLVLEPLVKNTAPAIAALCAAREQAAPGGIVVVLPADHGIADDKAFAETLISGAEAAQDGQIVIFGVTPTRPETGYGYIHARAASGRARPVEAFKEKPDLATAEQFLASGDYFWNAGIFMFRTDVMMAEMERHCPDILAAAQKAVSAGAVDGESLTLDAAAFDQAVELSIDFAVMERTGNAAVIPLDAQWSDIGSWATLWDIAAKSDAGNADLGDGAIFIDAKDTLAVSNGQKIAAIGVRDLVIVSTKDGILVADRNRCQDVKKVVEALREAGDAELF